MIADKNITGLINISFKKDDDLYTVVINITDSLFNFKEVFNDTVKENSEEFIKIKQYMNKLKENCELQSAETINNDVVSINYIAYEDFNYAF